LPATLEMPRSRRRFGGKDDGNRIVHAGIGVDLDLLQAMPFQSSQRRAADASARTSPGRRLRQAVWAMQRWQHRSE
jgi:hypothetical protein